MYDLNLGASDFRSEVFVGAIATDAARFNSPLEWWLVIGSLDIVGLSSTFTRQSHIAVAKSFHSVTCGNVLPADCVVDTWLHPAFQLRIFEIVLALHSLAD